jgi:hypothetical protein
MQLAQPNGDICNDVGVRTSRDMTCHFVSQQLPKDIGYVETIFYLTRPGATASV